MSPTTPPQKSEASSPDPTMSKAASETASKTASEGAPKTTSETTSETTSKTMPDDDDDDRLYKLYGLQDFPEDHKQITQEHIDELSRRVEERIFKMTPEEFAKEFPEYVGVKNFTATKDLPPDFFDSL